MAYNRVTQNTCTTGATNNSRKENRSNCNKNDSSGGVMDEVVINVVIVSAGVAKVVLVEESNVFNVVTLTTTKVCRM